MPPFIVITFPKPRPPPHPPAPRPLPRAVHPLRQPGRLRRAARGLAQAAPRRLPLSVHGLPRLARHHANGGREADPGVLCASGRR